MATGPLHQPTSLRLRRLWRTSGAAYLFILPTFVLCVIFILYPFASSFYLSLTDWDGARAVKNFIGLGNYFRLVQDRLLWQSLQNNVIWMVLGSAIPISLGLTLALLLWSRPRGFLTFRTLFFMPQIVGWAVTGIIWANIYRARRGVLPQLGQTFDWDFLKLSFLANPDLALYAVLLAAIWFSIGFFFVILLAGLQNVDMELIDAAKIDGANAAQRLWHVVIPQLSHVITVVTVLALIGGLKVFDIIWTMTRGGPGNATEVIGTYTYKKAFVESSVGYGAALSMVMALLALITSLVFLRIRERGQQ
jgi:ABC-type sugar transport system permease subunit